MNNLPEHRRIISGRTWREQWRPDDFNPLSLPRKALAMGCSLVRSKAAARARILSLGTSANT